MSDINDINSGHHFIAIFGGAVAGAEAASCLASRGFRVVVFDQGMLPYGKIEDGLPKWHAKLRDKEEQRINEKINQANVRFVPGVRLGEDVDFQDIVNNWGFTAVMLATGAWKDRTLPAFGAENFLDKGLIYQNPFVYWFNHYHEPNYHGPTFTIKDNAAVIGGGLASLDVVKIIMIETVQKALAARNIIVDIFTLERSIAKVLEEHNLTLADLGLKGCTLYYRRRAKDMPLTPMIIDTAEKLQKAELVRDKILANFQKKYLFHFVPCVSPVALVGDNELHSITFCKNEIIDGRATSIANSEFTVDASQVISSIGSVPEPLPGVPSQGAIFDVEDEETCRIRGFEHVYALGNAVTGRGNINESLAHGKQISEGVMDHDFHWQEADFEKWLQETRTVVEERMNSIMERIERKTFLPKATIEGIVKKTTELQQKVGYDGDYEKWVLEKRPIRLEDMLF